jgi:hypothetical protein
MLSDWCKERLELARSKSHTKRSTMSDMLQLVVTFQSLLQNITDKLKHIGHSFGQRSLFEEVPGAFVYLRCLVVIPMGVAFQN